MTSLYLSSKNKGYLKRTYMREGKKERKEKYEMTNPVIYNLTYLIVLCETNAFFFIEK